VGFPNLSLITACLIVAASSVPCPVLADDTASPPPPGSAPGPRLTAQSQAIADVPSPITVRLEYTGEVGDNVAGGLHDGATYMNNVLAQLHVNADQAFGWTGGHFVLEGFYENADSLDTQYVGAIQDPSTIDTSGVAMFRLYQAYYKQDLGHTNLLVGIYDLQTEFGATKPMDIFFNGAYAWNTTLDQSGLNGPSTYPSTSLAFRIRQKLGPYVRLQAAVLDGVPDSVKDPRATAVNINKTNGALLIAELDYVPTRTTKLMAGYWDYTGAFPAIDQASTDGAQRLVFGSRGGYFGGATRLYAPAAGRGLDLFANIGLGTARTQIVDRSLNVGLSYTGLFDDRPFDKMGVAVGVAHAGDAYRDMQIASGNRVDSYETNFELTYRAPITDWLTLQPDIQYWIQPSVDPGLKNDLLFLIHFEISHVFDL
jgi:porin